MKLEFSQQHFKKCSNIKFNENTTSGNWVSHADGRTDMTKLIVAFRSFVYAPQLTLDFVLYIK